MGDAKVTSMDAIGEHGSEGSSGRCDDRIEHFSSALHVRSLRLYEEFHREAHAKSPPAKLYEIIARCKAVVSNASQYDLVEVLGALRKRGTAHLILNQPRRALSAAEQIIRLRVDWPYGYLLKADALLALGQFAMALHLYQLTQQLMGPENPTDDFGRTEIDDQCVALSYIMAKMSCLTITPAHGSEITAVACWPLLSERTAAHFQTGRHYNSTSARALQETLSCAVNDALEAMSHGSAYVQLPQTGNAAPYHAAPPQPSMRPPEQSAPPHTEPTLDHILADKMRRQKHPSHTDQEAQPLQTSPPSAPDYISMLDTVASSTTATTADGPVLRSSTSDFDHKMQSSVPHGSARSPSPLRISEQDPDFTTSSSDVPPAAQYGALPQAASSRGGAGGSRHLSQASDSARLAPHLRTQLTTLSSEGASTGSLPWSTLTRTETQHFMATGDLQGHLRVWDVTRLEYATEIDGHTSGITCITFARNLRKGCALLMASGDAEGAVKVSAIDLNGNLIESQSLDVVHQNRVMSMHFFAGGHKLITSSVDTTIRLWNVATGQLTACLDGHKRPVTGMDCMSIMNAVAVATCSSGGTWYLWDLKLRRHFRTGKKPGAATLVRFSPYVHSFDNPRPLLVTAHWASKEASIHLWDAFDPELPASEVGPVQPWHSFQGVAKGQIQDIAFTLDQHNKTLMAVAALDGSLVIYDLCACSVLFHMTDGHPMSDGALL
jgi:WD40 repeat protein